MRATMDLLALYQQDNTLLDLLELPEDLERETVTDNLLMETVELELLYPNPVFLKMAIGSWSKKQLPIWNELLATTQYEYNPIWNKDGTVHELITRDLAATEDVSDDNTRTDNLTDLQTRNATDTRTDNLTDLTTNDLTDEQTRDLAGTSDGTNTNNVYGFNSSTGEPAGQTIQDLDTTDTGTLTDTHTGTQTEAHTGTQTDAHTGTITDSHTGTQTDNRTIDRDTTDTGTIDTFRTEQGNIGTTSTQSLIMEQRDVVKFNIIDIIIEDFKNRFCIRLY